MILGGQHVAMSLVLTASCQMHPFFTVPCFDQFFDMFKRNIEFLRLRMVVLAPEHKYDCDDRNALLFGSRMMLCETYGKPSISKARFSL